MKRIRTTRRSDEGAVLVIALVIVTTVALVTGALLTKGSGNFLATVSLRQVAGSAYAGDAAAKVAIADLENGTDSPDVKVPAGFSIPWVYDNYVDGSGCFGATQTATTITPTDSIQLPNLYPPTGSQAAATSARVECQVVTGSGALGSGQGVPITDLNSTDRALTILGDGSTAGDGLSVKPLGAGNANSFLVGGGLASNEKITVNNGALFTDSYAWAHFGCSGTIFSTPAPDCSHATVSDPAYNANASTVPAYQAIPSGCTFQPGYYDDAKALTDKTDDCPVSTFTPGTYYFDFHNNTIDPTYSANAVAGATSDVWSISNTVIGGVPTGATTPVGRCVSPIEDKTAQGVQFVFGGDSRLYLDSNAVMELCGTYSSDAPPIVLFGLNSGGPASLESPSGMTPTTVTATGFTGATPQAVSAEGGASATWSTTTAHGATGTVTMSGLVPAGIPAGSLLKSATLTLRHQESASIVTGGGGNNGGTNNGGANNGGTNNGGGNNGGTNNGNGAGGGDSNSDNVKPSLAVKIGSAAASATSAQPSTQQALATESLDLTGDLAKAVHDGTASNTELTFTETANGATSSRLDYANLALTYYPPTFRPQTTSGYGASNCVASGGCSFVDTKTNWSGTFVMNGVTYLPTGTVTIDPGNGNGLVAFRYGLFARGLTMKGQPKYQFGYPVVSIPELGPGFGSNVTVVDLKVYLCAEQSSCPTGSGTLSLTSRVKITDPVNVVPAPATRKIDVLSWSEQR